MAGRPYGAPPPGSSSWVLRLRFGWAWLGLAGPGLGVATNGPARRFHITRFSSSKVSYIVCPDSGGVLMTSTASAGPGAVASPRVPVSTGGLTVGRVAGREGGAGHRGRAEHRERDRAGARALRGSCGVQRPGPGGVEGGGAADLAQRRRRAGAVR